MGDGGGHEGEAADEGEALWAGDGRAGLVGVAVLVGVDAEEALPPRAALEVIDISNNLGDAKTLVTHPATTTHASMEPEARAAVGIGDNVIRLSVGLEYAGDLIEDLRRGLH